MDVLQWMSTSFKVVTAGFFALLPGTVFWLTVLGFYMLIQWIGKSHAARTLRGRAWTTRNSPRQIRHGEG
jgi:hypothetical protein